MPISTKLVAVAASAAVLMTGAGVALAATQNQPAPVAATVAVPLAATTTEVRVWADNTTHSVSLPQSATVADALAAADVSVGSGDRVSPALGATLALGDTVTVNRVSTSEETKVVTLDFTTTEVKDATLTKGERKVKTKGEKGTREDVVATVSVDGSVESTETVSQTVTKEPVTEVVLVGTRPVATVTSRSADRTATTAPPASAPAASAGNTSGAGTNLANAAMWDRIAQCESGGNWAINTGNGYYGGLQFSLASWKANGGTDFAAYPHQASRAEQITVANRYYAKAGLQPWGCRGAA